MYIFYEGLEEMLDHQAILDDASRTWSEGLALVAGPSGASRKRCSGPNKIPIFRYFLPPLISTYLIYIDRSVPAIFSAAHSCIAAK